jgi:Uma2 family endonuclease
LDADTQRRSAHDPGVEARRSTKWQLYARFGVPYYWIVDPRSRAVDVFRLAGAGYEGPRRFTGTLADLPPFEGLTLDPVSLWGPVT